MTEENNYHKRYYVENREKFLQRAKRRMTCTVCDKEITIQYLKEHEKSKVHKQALLLFECMQKLDKTRDDIIEDLDKYFPNDNNVELAEVYVTQRGWLDYTRNEEGYKQFIHDLEIHKEKIKEINFLDILTNPPEFVKNGRACKT